MIKFGIERARQYDWTDPQALLLFLMAYCLLGIGLVLLLLALREGELSTIYPVLATRYIWVVAVTPLLFANETFNLFKLTGAAIAAVGVGIITRMESR